MLSVCSYLSFQNWKAGKKNTPFILLSLFISSFLAFANGYPYIKGEADLIPTGMSTEGWLTEVYVMIQITVPMLLDGLRWLASGNWGYG